ncbi:MAG: 3'-5' exonuclease, partial [Desulfatiglandales bacterium]
AWVSRDVRAKEMYDITTDRVSLISVHSAKGLDFDLVYLVGMDRMRPVGVMWEKALSLVFTAMTRAKYRLVIPYVRFPGTVYVFLWRAARKAVMTSSCHGWNGAAEGMPSHDKAGQPPLEDLGQSAKDSALLPEHQLQ